MLLNHSQLILCTRTVDTGVRVACLDTPKPVLCILEWSGTTGTYFCSFLVAEISGYPCYFQSTSTSSLTLMKAMDASQLQAYLALGKSLWDLTLNLYVSPCHGGGAENFPEVQKSLLSALHNPPAPALLPDTGSNANRQQFFLQVLQHTEPSAHSKSCWPWTLEIAIACKAHSSLTSPVIYTVMLPFFHLT